MDKEEKKKNLVLGVSAAVGSTLSSTATESMMIKNEKTDDVEIIAVDHQHVTDLAVDESPNDSTAISPSTHEGSVVTSVPQNENILPISTDDVIPDPEPVMYGGPIVDDEDLVVIDIDSDMYGGPVEDIEPMMYGGPIPEDIEPVDIDCDIYG